MIQGLIVKLIFDSIYKAIQRKHNLKKIDDYVNKPNELDKKFKQSQKNLNKALKYIEVLEKDVGALKADSHPPLFTKKDLNKINRRLKKLENKEK
jgi:DNA repair ATPase RecN|tara:strand:+ start:356 stop:640 length:285 start_codon:yes stop_codon:yes gene_type:complete